ncbi:hypothetical protein HY086_00450 [Candidatus Gottesmanbacteria bacterium]|nr:hypothetical protein [Candidatus Gottesmanbacteria bacterium]
MDYKEIQKRLDAAGRILNADVTTPDKIKSLATLLHGVNPKLDATLKEVTHAFATLEKLEKFEVIELTAEAIPEITEKDKKRKKALLLLLRFWHDLKGEVKRVEKELKEIRQHGGDKAAQARGLGNILGLAKGPLGLITLVAVGLVALQSLAVKVTITNDGCDTIPPIAQFPIVLPGLQLPRQSIPAGSSAIAVLPPISLTVKTTRSSVSVSALGQQYSFDLPSKIRDIRYNGRSLLGTQTKIKLTKDTPQKITVRC